MIWSADIMDKLLCADDIEQLPGLFGAADVTDNMSLNSNTGHSPRDADAHNTGHMSLGYTHILEGGHHPAWGEPSCVLAPVVAGWNVGAGVADMAA